MKRIPTNAEIQSVLTAVISSIPRDWSGIAADLKVFFPHVKNFMIVRNALQGLISDGVVKRIPSVHVEQYYLGK